MSAFWDSSSIVPLCIEEPSSSFLNDVLRRQSQIVWWATRVESACAIARSCRSGRISAEIADDALLTLDGIAERWMEVEPTDRIRAFALDQVRQSDLRAADALQLAAAFEWCEEQPSGHRFICNDLRLSDAARTLGFDVVSYY